MSHYPRVVYVGPKYRLVLKLFDEATAEYHRGGESGDPVQRLEIVVEARHSDALGKESWVALDYDEHENVIECVCEEALDRLPSVERVESVDQLMRRLTQQ